MMKTELQNKNLRPGRFSANTDNDSGMVIILLVAGLAALIALFSLSVRSSYRHLVAAELQAAADSAAQAGAGVLCSHETCFQAAKLEAAKILNQKSLHQGQRGVVTLNIDETAGPIWTSEDGAYEITIYRGAWWPNGVPTGDDYEYVDTIEDDPTDAYPQGRFQLLDSIPQPPGAPAAGDPPSSPYASNMSRNLTANAIYVKITLKGIQDPISLLTGSSGTDMSSTAIAVAGDGGRTRIAPFAVPVCALIGKSQDFDPEERCLSDIYFTQANRYCSSDPDNTDCGVVPGFPAYPNENSSAGFPDASYVHGGWAEPIGIRTCPSQELGEELPTTDRFAFVGNTGGAAQSESQIRDAINSGGYLASIGDTFHVLQSGLTEPATATLLWSKMTDSYEGTAVGNGAWYTEEVGSINSESNGCSDNNLTRYGMCNSGYWQNNVTNQFFPAMANWDPTDNTTALRCTNARVFPRMSTEWVGKLPKMWKTKAAVVAWSGMPACGDGTTPDPIPPVNTDMTIVGFVELKVYDLDIGAAPPSPPDFVGMYPIDSNGNVTGPKVVADCTGTNNFQNGHPNWRFQPPGAIAPQNCNVVRARIACDASVVPSTDTLIVRNTEIVK